MRRALPLLPLLLLLVGVAGCPRDVETPEPHPAAPRCEARADCNDRTCGLLRACVDGLCEGEPSLVVPCLDGGARRDAGAVVDAGAPGDASARADAAGAVDAGGR